MIFNRAGFSTESVPFVWTTILKVTNELPGYYLR
jgi:hypothetical protein